MPKDMHQAYFLEQLCQMPPEAMMDVVAAAVKGAE
jgi:hypothetical protein